MWRKSHLMLHLLRMGNLLLQAHANLESGSLCRTCKNQRVQYWTLLAMKFHSASKCYMVLAASLPNAIFLIALKSDQLAQYDLSIADLTFVNIFISDMSTFPEVNQAYKSFFGTSPPARACVAVDLPPGVRIKLDCLAYSDESNERRALHVQSLSYWAPANIGPYSQAVIVSLLKAHSF